MVIPTPIGRYVFSRLSTTCTTKFTWPVWPCLVAAGAAASQLFPATRLIQPPHCKSSLKFETVTAFYPPAAFYLLSTGTSHRTHHHIQSTLNSQVSRTTYITQSNLHPAEALCSIFARTAPTLHFPATSRLFNLLPRLQKSAPARQTYCSTPRHVPTTVDTIANMSSNQGASNYQFPSHRLNLTQTDPTKTPLVLVACGSFSPVCNSWGKMVFPVLLQSLYNICQLFRTQWLIPSVP